jgi:SOS-response transcriptional repressor LexA
MKTFSERPALTDRQAAVLRFIRDFRDLNGFPPTTREIGGALGIVTTNGVRSHLFPLQTKGYLRINPSIARGIRVLDAPSEIPDDSTEYRSASDWPSWTGRLAFLPTNMQLDIP